MAEDRPPINQRWGTDSIARFFELNQQTLYSEEANERD